MPSGVHAGDQLEQHARDVPADVREALVEGLRYRRVDVADRASVAALLRAATGDGEAAKRKLRRL
jgi:hypothetical protein